MEDETEKLLQNLVLTEEEDKGNSATQSGGQKPKIYRFEQMWLKEAECEEVVARDWTSNIQTVVGRGITQRLADTSRALSKWNKEKFEKVSSHNQERDIKRQAPGSDFYKANFDGATKKNGHDNIGVVIRDSRGSVVASMANPVQHNNDSDLVESLALWKAVKLAKDLGIKNIHVEGDSLTVVKAINSAGIDRSHIGGVILWGLNTAIGSCSRPTILFGGTYEIISLIFWLMEHRDGFVDRLVGIETGLLFSDNVEDGMQ
ncbi:hypothetical protein U1Q18_037118 [Sarracenia purpurea var. burkii]